MCRLADRICKTAAVCGSMREIECDLRELCRASAQVGRILDDMEYAASRYSTCPLSRRSACSTALARRILRCIDACIADMDAIVRRPAYAPPVRILETPAQPVQVHHHNRPYRDPSALHIGKHNGRPIISIGGRSGIRFNF